jgi:hypothetical protein
MSMQAPAFRSIPVWRRRCSFKLQKPHRRINRNRYCAGTEDAEEGDEKIDACRKHDADPVARRHVMPDQTLCEPLGPGCKFSVGEGAENRRLVLQYGQMQPIGMTCGMPLEHLDQGARFMGGRHCRKGRWRCCSERRVLKCRPSLLKRSEEIFDGLGLADRLCGKVHMKGTFDAQD